MTAFLYACTAEVLLFAIMGICAALADGPAPRGSTYIPRHAYVPPVILTLRLDTTKFDSAMRDLQRSTRAAAEGLARGLLPALRRLTQVMGGLDPVLVAQTNYGLGNRDDAGRWQSDMCAAWLHESCPLPDHCDCESGCHR